MMKSKLKVEKNRKTGSEKVKKSMERFIRQKVLAYADDQNLITVPGRKILDSEKI